MGADLPMLTRPILGGVFGAGRYVLATRPCVMRGLHAVRFMVVEPSTGGVLSLADGKREALDAAREAIRVNRAIEIERAEARGHDPRQGELWPEDRQVPRPVIDKRRPISKRRREVFAKSNGGCFYCGRPLALDGTWHVEHQLPRALGGDDSILNLVASCAPCNLAKSDRTALEFINDAGPGRT